MLKKKTGWFPKSKTKLFGLSTLEFPQLLQLIES